MKKRPVILHILAFFLILVISQKSGAGLALHNILHTKNIIAEHQDEKDQRNKNLGYVCACMDDFFMPFDEIILPACSQPIFNPGSLLVFFDERVSLQASYFVTLRGPPAV